MKARRALRETTKWEREDGGPVLSPNPEMMEKEVPANPQRRPEQETPQNPRSGQCKKALLGLDNCLNATRGLPRGQNQTGLPCICIRNLKVDANETIKAAKGLWLSPPPWPVVPARALQRHTANPPLTKLLLKARSGLTCRTVMFFRGSQRSRDDCRKCT